MRTAAEQLMTAGLRKRKDFLLTRSKKKSYITTTKFVDALEQNDANIVPMIFHFVYLLVYLFSLNRCGSELIFTIYQKTYLTKSTTVSLSR